MSRIDDSHYTFKRTQNLGPGPKKRKLSMAGNWECQKGTNTKTHYVQSCTYVGPDRDKRGKKRKVRRKKSSKKAYNRLFRAFAKRSKRLKALQARGRRPGYRCRKTRVAKCK